MTELKPCPFCGNDAIMNLSSIGAVVNCLTLGCDAEIYDFPHEPYSCIERWNTRKPHQAIKEFYEKWKHFDEKLQAIDDDHIKHTLEPTLLREAWQAIKSAVEGKDVEKC